MVLFLHISLRTDINKQLTLPSLNIPNYKLDGIVQTMLKKFTKTFYI